MPAPVSSRATRLRRCLVACASTAAVFLAMDAAWLTVMADRLYRPALGRMFREGFDLPAAAGFYVLYIAGVATFVVLRRSGGPWTAAARGAFFGLVAYGAYDLTNQATLLGWPWHVTAADLCWGTLATGVAAGIGRALAERAGGASR